MPWKIKEAIQRYVERLGHLLSMMDQTVEGAVSATDCKSSIISEVFFISRMNAPSFDSPSAGCCLL